MYGICKSQQSLEVFWRSRLSLKLAYQTEEHTLIAEQVAYVNRTNKVICLNVIYTCR
ncbi:hypothetical protein WN48_06920 [Eufriesea mexicana]|uniref:Uncharacterized protein n=1 Tax=Eufriesea mexicana TaxID=516756 RepID=A0A310SU81_9HYME|nr:hypothetical protein WN48_06920 [Eufriesea mexicana]